MLAPPKREELLDEITKAIDGHGESSTWTTKHISTWPAASIASPIIFSFAADRRAH
jgi:hypothetical protein